MNITVIGCGRWGSFLAWYLDKIGHTVLLYGRAESEKMQQLSATRSNGQVVLPPSVQLCTSLSQALQNNVVVISVGSQGLRGLLQGLVAAGAQNKLYVLCMKGLEIGTGKRLTQVVAEEADPGSRAAVWLGPGHVQEFVRGVPNCMVIDAENKKDKEQLVEAFSSDLIRFYYGDDLIGNEIGAAAKNVVGIAAGMLDGFDLSSLKGALMSRGTREVARLIVALGGQEFSAYGLCHLGDYEATVFSRHSHNRMYGEKLVKGEPYTNLAEGYYTVKALMELAGKTGVELPISAAVYNILYKGAQPKEALNKLFARSLKQEF
ncbi:NAD(P)H-dependent glycerol-3-phosphate dehydrogenase [Ruminococcaceae bacterium OttesenSCG-928-A16]|nr:NAD(P)H-dependent glycerol-3-phosphate dehydrogenase [Ruminococcaceae bacterium OttesenSCG-928-A16]